MKRIVLLLLAVSLLIAVPGAASATIITPVQSATGYGNTYYSNVPGWSLSLRTYYYPVNTTQYRVTRQTLYAYLSATKVYFLGTAYYNTTGYIGPVSMNIYSSGSSVAYGYFSARYCARGGSTTFDWSPNVLTRRGYTYGRASALWTQNVYPKAYSTLSSSKPCVVKTYMF